MIYLGVLLCVGIGAAIITMALRKKSDFSTRVAALIALALMMLTIIICLFVFFTDDTVPVDPSRLIVGAPKETKEGDSTNIMVLTLLIIFMILLFGFIVVTTMREHKKNIAKIKESSFSKW